MQSFARRSGWRIFHASARIAATGVRLGHLSVVGLALAVRCLRIGITLGALAVHLAATPRLLRADEEEVEPAWHQLAV